LAALAAATAAGALVFWAFDALPFQDLPAHAGLIALRHRLEDSPFEQRFYVLAPHLSPYSLFRAAGDWLLSPLGPVGAVRALMTLAVLAIPAALAWARSRLQGDGVVPAAFFGFCLSFGFMTIMGFASYLLGMAAVLVALTLWLEAMRAADDLDSSASRREVAVALFTPWVLLVHGYAFVIFLGLALVVAAGAGRPRRRLVRIRALAPAAALAGWMQWRDHVEQPAAAFPSPSPGLHFSGCLDKLSLIVTPTLMTRWGIDVLVGLGIWLVVAGALRATFRRLPGGGPDSMDPVSPHTRGLLVAIAGLAIAFLLLPHSIGWFGFVDGRLVPLVLMLGVLATDRRALGPRLGAMFDAGAPIAALVLVAVAWAASFRFQSEASGWRQVLAAVPENSRLLNLPLDPDSDVFTGHPFVHYDKLAMASRPTVVSDVWFHQGTALYPSREHPALGLPATYSESHLVQIDWPAYRLTDWDYVLLRTRPDASAPQVPGSLALAAHRGGWWLYSTPRGGHVGDAL
jgi:hypothetical protein